ncbi:MAG TPA: porin [Stellaceae bacterium]|nr:porin [Stellaceae bacterium]
MSTRNLKGGVALGSLTAVVALLAGLSNASAQSAPGAGSFPQSFLVPGTNTSLAIYGTVKMNVSAQWGSQHTTDTSPSGIGNTAFAINGLALGGPGAPGGNSVNNQEHAINGGLRGQVKSTQVFFETRTPSDLGEIKTVVMFDFGTFGLQANYIGRTTSTNSPSSGAGNNEMPRIQFAYGTLGPWLFGQYNSAWTDPLQINPDIGDQNQVGPLQTRNIRRPQIRYTYLVGNGLSLSASLETNTYTNLTGNNTTTLGPIAEDSTDTGGITNYPSFNAGVAWDQPWGHLMARVGVAEDEIRSTTNTVLVQGSTNLNKRKTAWAIEGGVMINTFGQDQWRGLVVYSQGADTYLTDMGAMGLLNTQTGTLDLVHELAFNTSYIHRFSPNWRATAEFGIGFFNKPGNAPNSGAFLNVANGTTGAGLAGLEKRHLESGLSVTYSPVPGKVDFGLEWDHWERWVQAADTSGHSNIYSAKVAFFW